MSKIKVVACTEGDESIFFVAGYDERIYKKSNDPNPKEVRCIR